jgi:PAT family beta-lactamase induction signal transducer AmpG
VSSPGRWLGTLFFAEGVPATAVLTLSAILLKRLEMPNEQIAVYTSVLLLPWIARPLWSPLLEIVKTTRFFVVTTETVIAAGFFGIAVCLSGPHRIAQSLLLFAVVAIAAATHDTAADGLYLVAIPPALQARFVGWLGVSFVAGKLITQGLVVILAGLLEPGMGVVAAWRAVFVILGGLMAVLAWHHSHALPTVETERGATSIAHAALTSSAVVTGFFRKPHLAVLIPLVVLYRFSEGQLARIAPLFILDPRAHGGLGLSTIEVGTYYGALGGAAFMVGAIGGGRLAESLGLRRLLLPLCALCGAPTLLYLALAHYQPGSAAVVGMALIAEQLAYGVSSIGLKLVMMQSLAAGPFPSAHFAFATSLASLGITAGGMTSAAAQSRWGYRGFFLWALVTAIPAVVAAAVARRRAPDVRGDPQ